MLLKCGHFAYHRMVAFPIMYGSEIQLPAQRRWRRAGQVHNHGWRGGTPVTGSWPARRRCHDDPVLWAQRGSDAEETKHDLSGSAVPCIG